MSPPELFRLFLWVPPDPSPHPHLPVFCPVSLSTGVAGPSEEPRLRSNPGCKQLQAQHPDAAGLLSLLLHHQKVTRLPKSSAAGTSQDGDDPGGGQPQPRTLAAPPTPDVRGLGKPKCRCSRRKGLRMLQRAALGGSSLSPGKKWSRKGRVAKHQGEETDKQEKIEV